MTKNFMMNSHFLTSAYCALFDGCTGYSALSADASVFYKINKKVEIASVRPCADNALSA